MGMELRKDRGSSPEFMSGPFRWKQARIIETPIGGRELSQSSTIKTHLPMTGERFREDELNTTNDRKPLDLKLIPKHCALHKTAAGGAASSQ
ncbi:hypothetical protein [Sinorhizobium americanum]|uniref:hypothetical protein n=1 Tax=Sinorhizobium americanum TaxID=194963 RepID=UPI00104C597B|nr:hypothetical protein [Sinorhizobium americanum]